MTLSWVPNAITFLRIALIVPVVYGILSGHYALALAAFVIAGVSDGVDGFLAKRFGWRTRLGALMDPLADKFLTAAAYVSLAMGGQIPTWLAATVIVRDIVIVGGATAYHFLIAPVPGEPTLVSKFNTAIELLLVVAVLLRAAFDWPGALAITIIGAGVLVTVAVSGIDYVIRWSRKARLHGQSAESHS